MQPKRKRGRPRTVEREGVHNLSVNEICRRTKLSKPSLYREFGGEDGLLAAALAAYEKVVIAPLSADINPDLPFAQTLNTMVDQLTTPRNGPAGCLLVEVRDSQASQGPLTQASVAGMVARIQTKYAEWFRLAQSRGETGDGLSPKRAARYIDAQISMVLRRMAAGEPPDQIAAEGKLALSALPRKSHE